MTQGKGDTSRNDSLHFQIAMIYLTKTSKRPWVREESLRNAALHLDQALDIHDSAQPQEMDIMLFEIGGAYEILGNLSEKERCKFYGRSKDALERQLPLIQGDSYTTYGKTIPLEPARTDVRKHLESVGQKIVQFGCSTQ